VVVLMDGCCGCVQYYCLFDCRFRAALIEGWYWFLSAEDTVFLFRGHTKTCWSDIGGYNEGPSQGKMVCNSDCSLAIKDLSDDVILLCF